MAGNPQGHTLITGASSGIGAALALRCAAPGARLSLWGRDPARLHAVAERARAAGAEVAETVLDLGDAAGAVARAEAADDRHPFDTAILAAGRGGVRPAGLVTEAADEAARIAAVNFLAPVAMATALAGRMAVRGRGRIALIGSTAAFFPLPQAPAYAASKAGLAVFARALRLGVAASGVGVTLVSPGFIDTPMSRGIDTAKPFLMPADAAAARIVAAIGRNKAHVIFPRPFALLPVVGWLMPPFMRDRLLMRLGARPM